MNMASTASPAHRPTVYQLVDEEGAPSKAAHTLPLWVDKQQSNIFADPTEGNKIIPFVTGADYFRDLIDACNTAKEEIYIAGWQVNWDALLAPDVRLIDLLMNCARRGVNIFVMPWNDTEPIQTYDDQCKAILEGASALLSQSEGAGRIVVELCSSFAGTNSNYFSHHQKQVVVDRQIAYVGGIDLSYGRFDDTFYRLRANWAGRQVLNMYNPGLPSLKFLDRKWKKFVDPDLTSGVIDRFKVTVPFTDKTLVKSNAQVQLERAIEGGWQIRYAKPGMVDTGLNSRKISSNTPDNGILDAERQPRMPWNDVHCRIEGPAVADLTRNFVGRWNAISKCTLRAVEAASSYAMVGKAYIQVLRSASSRHCQNESSNARKNGGGGTQQDIHAAMQNVIAKATKFIYIENQFFVSDFGAMSGDSSRLSPAALHIKDGDEGISDTSLKALRALSKGVVDELPQNKILAALLARLKQVILDGVKRQPFHIYVTVPVHPEGSLNDPAVAVQVYYTMQTLVYGSMSLMNGVRRLLKARQLKDSGDKAFLRVWTDESNEEFSDISDADCYEYVTLLNLRNWEKIDSAYVTEQIYIHSKLMVVDDRFAILGSANINDRSMLGERDSELSVLVIDGDVSRVDLDGSGKLQPARNFARTLRKQVWRKIFGITSKYRAANELEFAINQPANPKSWKAIQSQAVVNQGLYEAAFPFIPRDYLYGDEDGVYASILPTWSSKLKNARGEVVGGLSMPLPYQKEFWSEQRHTKEAENLQQIKGFFTAMPIHWTRGENIAIKFPTAIIVKNEPSEVHRPADAPTLAVNDDKRKTKELT